MQCDDWKIEKSKWKCMKLENQAVGSVRFVCVCAGWCKRKSHAMHVSNVFGECIQPEIRHQMTIEPKFQRAYLLLTTKGNSLIFRAIQWRTFIPIVSHTHNRQLTCDDGCVLFAIAKCVSRLFSLLSSHRTRVVWNETFFPPLKMKHSRTGTLRHSNKKNRAKIARRLAKKGIKTLGLCWDTWMGVFQCGWQQFGHVFKPNECINVDFVQEATGEKTRSSD